jgi:hypothetical protein
VPPIDPRTVIARATPAWAKRRHERWLTERRQRAVAGPTARYLAEQGRTVRHGPLAGLEYPPALDATGDLVAKLLGTYELELREELEAWVAAGHAHVIDVGCAEGYYAVGLARAMPSATVHAFDIDAAARERCAALAAANGVQERVVLGGMCTPQALQAGFPASGVALFSDCEGYERVLLDPDAAPVLAGWAILVELHEFLDPEITDVIATRFAATHDVRVIGEMPRRGETLPELAGFSPAERAVLLDEHRPAAMRWAALRPR